MKRFFRRLRIEWKYFGKPSWDTGVSPPELLEYLASHPSGRALDLGCGSGTNVMTIAQAGWEVCGVDISGRAISLAKKKIRQHGLKAHLKRESVTDLRTIKGRFDLILDIGCYHQLDPGERQIYHQNIHRLLKEGGDFLLYAHYKNHPEDLHGVDGLDLEQFSMYLRLIRRNDGQERNKRPSLWLLYHKETLR
ncbi:MAG: class I SAM-dependent methyltransferase [Chloroflexota bacterium]